MFSLFQSGKELEAFVTVVDIAGLISGAHKGSPATIRHTSIKLEKKENYLNFNIFCHILAPLDKQRTSKKVLQERSTAGDRRQKTREEKN
jgi:hypothetical protein